jgi:hypothetical protein
MLENTESVAAPLGARRARSPNRTQFSGASGRPRWRHRYAGSDRRRCPQARLLVIAAEARTHYAGQPGNTGAFELAYYQALLLAARR